MKKINRNQKCLSKKLFSGDLSWKAVSKPKLRRSNPVTHLDGSRCPVLDSSLKENDEKCLYKVPGDLPRGSPVLHGGDD
jgi:hypothetical protein